MALTRWARYVSAGHTATQPTSSAAAAVPSVRGSNGGRRSSSSCSSGSHRWTRAGHGPLADTGNRANASETTTPSQAGTPTPLSSTLPPPRKLVTFSRYVERREHPSRSANGATLADAGGSGSGVATSDSSTTSSGAAGTASADPSSTSTSTTDANSSKHIATSGPAISSNIDDDDDDDADDADSDADSTDDDDETPHPDPLSVLTTPLCAYDRGVLLADALSFGGPLSSALASGADVGWAFVDLGGCLDIEFESGWRVEGPEGTRTTVRVLACGITTVCVAGPTLAHSAQSAPLRIALDGGLAFTQTTAYPADGRGVWATATRVELPRPTLSVLYAGVEAASDLIADWSLAANVPHAEVPWLPAAEVSRLTAHPHL